MMQRAACRVALRHGSPRPLLRATTRRWASTTVERPRSWKSSAVRWGLAGGAVYYYSTSSVFAEEASDSTGLIPAPSSSAAESDLQTVEAVIEEKRKETRSRLAREQAHAEPTTNTSSSPREKSSADAGTAESTAESPSASPQSPEALEEEEESQEGAFNPATGEINWDCPCLGGMAHGPCGEEFRAAFSCFVYSEEEPKGMDCIEKFQGMQECFRKYPDIYGAELAEEEGGEETEDGQTQPPAAPEGQPSRDKEQTSSPPDGADTKSRKADESHTETSSPSQTEPKTRMEDASEAKPPPKSEASSAQHSDAKFDTTSVPGPQAADTTGSTRWSDATDANNVSQKADGKADRSNESVSKSAT